MVTFRFSVVMALVVVLATLLIAIQARTLRLATQDAASAYMDAAWRQRFANHPLSLFSALTISKTVQCTVP
jgi:hypothetical protein